jgi:competence protein ComEA
MRKAFISSLLFAFLSSATVAVNAAPVAPAPASASAVSATALIPASDKLSINNADAETLQRGLTGIGAAKAAAIVAYREENGAFTSVDELLEVKGIGKAILEKNRDKLSID